MVRRTSQARSRPGWERQAASNPSDTQISRRRWRILQNARPPAAPIEPVPAWIHTPEQFVEWLSVRLDPVDLTEYFRDLEEIARRSFDLELLRFARRYLGHL